MTPRGVCHPYHHKEDLSFPELLESVSTCNNTLLSKPMHITHLTEEYNVPQTQIG